MLFCSYFYNIKKYKETLKANAFYSLSHKFQLSENIRSIKLLWKACFVSFWFTGVALIVSSKRIIQDFFPNFHNITFHGKLVNKSFIYGSIQFPYVHFHASLFFYRLANYRNLERIDYKVWQSPFPIQLFF